MDVPKGIGNGNAVSMFFSPCNKSRDNPFGGTKPARITSAAFALRTRVLRASSKGTIDNPQGQIA
jgi:hypothetical protein